MHLQTLHGSTGCGPVQGEPPALLRAAEWRVAHTNSRWLHRWQTTRHGSAYVALATQAAGELRRALVKQYPPVSHVWQRVEAVQLHSPLLCTACFLGVHPESTHVVGLSGAVQRGPGLPTQCMVAALPTPLPPCSVLPASCGCSQTAPWLSVHPTQRANISLEIPAERMPCKELQMEHTASWRPNPGPALQDGEAAWRA